MAVNTNATPLDADMKRNPTNGDKGARVRSVFSGALFARDLRANMPIALALLVIMMLMCGVLTAASNILSTEADTLEEEQQQTLFAYLGGLAAYNQSVGEKSGVELSAEDFLNTGDREAYGAAFDFINNALKPDDELTVEEFASTIDAAQATDIGLDTYVREFEYAFALAQSKGAFTGDDLDLEDLMETVFATMGKSNLLDANGEMNASSLLNTMYFKVVGLLPIFILVVLLGNSLIASLVDKGSMAYILSTPTKRSAVAVTQMAVMIIVPAVMVAVVCAEKIAVTTAIAGEANAEMLMTMYVGWYLLIETVAALCYFGSCLFNTSGKALAFGGGLAVWFFIASFLASSEAPNW